MSCLFLLFVVFVLFLFCFCFGFFWGGGCFVVVFLGGLVSAIDALDLVRKTKREF